MERTESSRQNLQQQSTDGRHGTDNPEGRVSRNGDGQQLRRDAPAFEQRGSNVETRERGYKTGNSDSVSLMILPAIINNGRRALKVNVMLDPCSTSSYVSETAAEELGLKGQPLDLTISGTGGTEVRRQSRRVELLYTSLCSLLPGCKQPCGISNPRPGLTPGTALRAVGSGINT